MNCKKLTIMIIMMVTSINLFSQSVEKVGKTKKGDKNIEWEFYDINSSVSIDSIDSGDIQGLWEAYRGVYKFGDVINEMKLSKPFIIEVSDSLYRRNSSSDFDAFVIKQNLLIKINTAKPDTGIINKLTKDEFTITWKKKGNYTRYYYEK